MVECWMRWQVLICALMTAVSAAAATAVISKSSGLRFSVDLCWVPCWRSLHPLYLLSYRILVLSVMAWLLYELILLDGAFAFYFYTQWTFTLVILYFAIGTLISAHGCWIYARHANVYEEASGFLGNDLEEYNLTYNENKKRDVGLRSHNELEVNVKGAGLWGYMMQVVYQTSAGAVILTDVVFWGLLVPFLSVEHFRLNTIMVCMHSLNAVFLLVDTALNRMPFPWFGMAYFVLWSCIYIIFQWLLHACGFSWWPYPFLELDTPWAPLWYLCLALVHIPCYGVYWMIAKWKNAFFIKLFPDAYIRSR